jgi:hypothetical protein
MRANRFVRLLLLASLAFHAVTGRAAVIDDPDAGGRSGFFWEEPGQLAGIVDLGTDDGVSGERGSDGWFMTLGSALCDQTTALGSLPGPAIHLDGSNGEASHKLRRVGRAYRTGTWSDELRLTGTKLTWRIEGKGFGVSVIGRLFAKIYSKNLDRAFPLFVEEMNASHE